MSGLASIRPSGSVAPRLVLAGLALPALMGLGACSNCSDDPSQAGLGCAVVNTQTGVYEARDAEIRAEIAALEARRDSLAREARRLSAEAARLQGESARAAERLSTINQRTSRMHAELADLTRKEQVDRGRLALLQAQAADLADELEGADVGDQAEIERLEAERARLQSEISTLIDATV